MKEISRFSREFEVLLADGRDYEAAGAAKTQLYWVQESLNALDNAGLPLTGRFDPAAKAAIRSFQSRQGLPATEKADPPTERRLMEELAMRNAGFLRTAQVGGIIQTARAKIEDWTGHATPPPKEKAHLVTNQYRNLNNVWALVLHHMAFKRRDKKKNDYSQPESYLSTRAHFCILFDGRIIQLHPVSRMIWHSNCTSPGSVGVEFEGNFPKTDGTWWYPKDKETGRITARDEDYPTKAQVEAGRFLIQYLQAVNGLREVLAHRQSSKDRSSDPGPDIWYNVGQWAVSNLGANDGGPGFKCGDGTPLPDEWRNWTDKNLVGGVIPVVSSLPSRPASPAPSTAPRPASTNGIPKAHQANRYYAEKLGWDAYRLQLYPLLGFPDSSPTEDLLAGAVAGWQRRNGFSGKDADGIIGPKTWEKMKQALGMAGTPDKTTAASLPAASSVPGAFQQGLNWLAGKISGAGGISSFAQTWGDKVAAGKYLDQAAHARLPQLHGKPWEQMNAPEKRAFNNTWVEGRTRLLEERKRVVLGGAIPRLGTAKIPFGFSMPATGKYAGKGLGIDSKIMARPRLDETLVSLHRRGRIKLTQDQLDIFQRIANVESSGKIQTLNTYDSGIVSIGFMQFTLHVGKIQEWILLNESAFKRFGIELDKRRKHNFGNNELHYMISGVDFANRNELRWNGWAERFYYAGLDDDIIAAQAALAQKYLEKHLKGLKNRLKNDSIYDAFLYYYQSDPYVRGLFQESYNNRPAKAADAVRDAVQKLGKSPRPVEEFLGTYTQGLIDKDWSRLVKEVAKGTTLHLS